MSYTLEILDDGHIMLVVLGADFDIHTDIPASIQDRLAHLDSGPDHIVQIVDTRNYSPSGLEAILAGSNQVHSPETKQLNQHPKLLKRVTITDSRLGLIVIKGLNTAAFGHLDISIFGTVEEGLEYARKVLTDTVKTQRR